VAKHPPQARHRLALCDQLTWRLSANQSDYSTRQRQAVYESLLNVLKVPRFTSPSYLRSCLAWSKSKAP